MKAARETKGPRDKRIVAPRLSTARALSQRGYELEVPGRVRRHVAVPDEPVNDHQVDVGLVCVRRLACNVCFGWSSRFQILTCRFHKISAAHTSKFQKNARGSPKVYQISDFR